MLASAFFFGFAACEPKSFEGCTSCLDVRDLTESQVPLGFSFCGGTKSSVRLVEVRGKALNGIVTKDTIDGSLADVT